MFVVIGIKNFSFSSNNNNKKQILVFKDQKRRKDFLKVLHFAHDSAKMFVV